MTINSNPFVLSAYAKNRQDEFLAEAECHRQARLAAGQRDGERRPLWADLASLGAVMAALVQPLAAGAATGDPEAALNAGAIRQ